MLVRGLNSPLTSSVGRLFDAIASLTDLCHLAGFEGQAAMALEFTLTRGGPNVGPNVEMNEKGPDSSYPFRIIEKSDPRPEIIIDWEPMVREIIADVLSGVAIGLSSARFHNTLVESLVTVAGMSGEKRICLTGGCFQNRYLTERAVSRLRAEGYYVYWHQRVPPNDGGIALGQAVAAARYLERF
jgi:hydrogenase maturation protein HypF